MTTVHCNRMVVNTVFIYWRKWQCPRSVAIRVVNFFLFVTEWPVSLPNKPDRSWMAAVPQGLLAWNLWLGLWLHEFAFILFAIFSNWKSTISFYISFFYCYFYLTKFHRAPDPAHLEFWIFQSLRSLPVWLMYWKNCWLPKSRVPSEHSCHLTYSSSYQILLNQQS